MAGDGRSEAAVLDACRALLKKRGAWYQKTQQGGKSGGRRGIPDLLVCYDGCFIAIELKAPKARKPPYDDCTTQQKLEIQAIRKAGGISAAINHENQLAAILDQVDDIYDMNEMNGVGPHYPEVRPS